ncbi:MAG: hypothetical protein JRJ39_17970 [Deltaproteobacteria bacterium]|nr:hypothetical protein [Deltaproteobacteria bacterium]
MLLQRIIIGRVTQPVDGGARTLDTTNLYINVGRTVRVYVYIILCEKSQRLIG